MVTISHTGALNRAFSAVSLRCGLLNGWIKVSVTCGSSGQNGRRSSIMTAAVGDSYIDWIGTIWVQVIV